MNRFALLADEGDSGDESPVQQKVTPKAVAPAPAAIPGSAAAGRQQQQSNRSSKPDYPARGTGRKVYGGDKPATDGAAGDAAEITKDSRSSYGENRGRGGRGASRGRGAPRSGNRQYDRHSQTNHVDSHKQEHQAWGGDDGKRELNDENEGLKDAVADASGAATPTVPATLDGAEGTPVPTPSQPVAEPEPEDNTKTYAEYLAEQAERAQKLGTPAQAPRKANEGADDSQWKDAVALSKKDEDETYFGGSKENKQRKRPTKEGKTYIEVEARFPRPGGEGRGRGRGEGRGRGRGEGRGRGGGGERGRGAPRSAPQPQALDTSDANAFPSLS